MKKTITITLIAIGLISFSVIPARANGGPFTWYAAMAASGDNTFNLSVQPQDDEERIRITIENPERKNLYIALKGPDGSTVDNFYTGRKFVKMNKAYNFSGADAGVYTIVISDGVHTISKRLEIARYVPKPVSKIVVE